MLVLLYIWELSSYDIILSRARPPAQLIASNGCIKKKNKKKKGGILSFLSDINGEMLSKPTQTFVTAACVSEF